MSPPVTDHHALIAFLTWAGLVLTVVGLGFALVAFQRTRRQYGAGPLWPLGNRFLRRSADWLRQVATRLLRRPRLLNRAAADAVGTTDVATSATAVATPPAVSADLPVAEQVQQLLARLELLERRTAGERDRLDQAVVGLHAELAGHVGRLTGEIVRIDTKATDIAVGTVRLQIAGLVFVAVGTVGLAAPALLGL